MGSLLQSEIDPIANPVDYRRLAFTATFFAGITQATLGVLRYATLTRRDCINLPSTNVYDCLVFLFAWVINIVMNVYCAVVTGFGVLGWWEQLIPCYVCVLGLCGF